MNMLDNHVDPDTVGDIIRANLCSYTRRAFKAIPEMRKPRILDIGCGSGVPTIELAMLCDCRIVALDNDNRQLNRLGKKIKELGLDDSIEIVSCSINNLNFDNESFDIIWSEGSIFVVGFERGLKEWRRFLRPGGYMGIHDERGNVEKKLKLIAGCGYKLLDHFILDKDIWWNKYYGPLENRIKKLQSEHSESPDLSIDFAKEKREILMFKRNPRKFESVFFIIQKSNL